MRSEGGYTAVEMVVVMSILSFVLAGLTTLFVAGSSAELDMNRRFQAQLNARLALDQLRRDVHCASAATASSATSVTLTIPCIAATYSNTVSWCTVSVGGATNRYSMYRRLGTGTCDATAKPYADYLTTGNVFTYQTQHINSLAKLHVSLPVDVKPGDGVGAYTLCDDIVFRNSSRTGAAGTAAPPC